MDALGALHQSLWFSPRTHTEALRVNNESCSPHRRLPVQAKRSSSRGHAPNSIADHTETWLGANKRGYFEPNLSY